MLNKDAVRRLQEVRRAILAEPDMYDQSVYAAEKNPCGSACCLAGWVVWLESPKRFKAAIHSSRGMASEAEEILGFPRTGAMFGTGRAWAEPHASEFIAARNNVERAKAAARYIDAIIASDGGIL